MPKNPIYYIRNTLVTGSILKITDYQNRSENSYQLRNGTIIYRNDKNIFESLRSAKKRAEILRLRKIRVLKNQLQKLENLEIKIKGN